MKNIKEQRIKSHSATKQTKMMEKFDSEYEKAWERLPEKTELYRQIFDRSPFGIGIATLGGRVVVSNRTMQNITGYSADELAKIKLSDTYVKKEDRKALFTTINRLGYAVDFPVRLKRKNGTPYDALLNVSKIKVGNKEFVQTICQDITGRKQVEKALQESEKRYFSLFEDSPISLSEEDFSEVKKRLDALKAQGVTDIRAYLESHPQEVADCASLVKVTHVNRATLELFKVKKKGEIKDLSRNITAGFLENFIKELVAIAQGKTKYESDVANKITANEEKNSILSWSVLPGHESDYSRVLVSLVDITQRKQTEQALTASENKFRWLYEYAPTAYHILTPDGILMDVNRKWCQIMGFSKEEVLGREIFDFIVEEERKAAGASFKIKKTSKQFYVEGRERNYMTKAGLVRTFKTMDFLVKDQSQNITSIQTTLEDITDRKQAEKSLQESEGRYRSLFEDSPVSLWEEDFSAVKQRLDALKAQGVTDLRAYLESHPQEVADCAALVRILDVNKAGLDLFKAEKKDDIKGHLSKILPPGALKDFQVELVNIAEGRTNFNWEGVNQTLAGEPIDISMSFSVVPGHEGDLSKTLLTIADITDRRQSEKEMRLIINNLRNLSEVEKKNRLFAEALARNVATIKSTLKTDEILDSIIENINDIVPSDAISIMLIQGEHAKIVRSRGYAERGLADWVKQMQFNLDELKTFREIIQSKKCKITSNTEKSQDWITLTETDWIKSNIIAPIIENNVVIGFVNVDSTTPDFYSEEHVRQMVAFTDQVSTALKNAREFEATQRRLNHMQAMTLIDQAINASLDLNVSLEIVLMQIKEQLHTDAVDILLVNEVTNSLVFYKSKGFRTDEIRKSNLSLGTGLPGKAIMEKTTVAIPDLNSVTNSYFKSLLIEKEGFSSYYCVPLIAKGQIKGVTEVYFRETFKADQEWLEFLEMFAQQTAIAINNAEMLNSLHSSNIELSNAYESTLKGWVDALDMRDHETVGHTQRVTDLSLKLARHMGIKDKDIVNFQRGALLHDIGKVAIPDAILNKPGPLTEEEWTVMRKHPLHAYSLLSKSNYLLPAMEIPLHHHEKWDGSGYPAGLKGEAIPLAARIFAIVDVWDALTSDRPYRKAWTEKKTLEYIQEQSGKHFDPQLVKVFLENPSFQGKDAV